LSIANNLIFENIKILACRGKGIKKYRIKYSKDIKKTVAIWMDQKNVCSKTIKWDLQDPVKAGQGRRKMRIRFTYIVVFFLLFGLAGDVLTIDTESSVKNKICALSCSNCPPAPTSDDDFAGKHQKTTAADPQEKTNSEGVICVADGSGSLNCYLRLGAGAAKPAAETKSRRRAPK
jgi:hypothetical protein